MLYNGNNGNLCLDFLTISTPPDCEAAGLMISAAHSVALFAWLRAFCIKKWLNPVLLLYISGSQTLPQRGNFQCEVGVESEVQSSDFSDSELICRTAPPALISTAVNVLFIINFHSEFSFGMNKFEGVAKQLL
jgi:hypothetical protein